MRIFTSHVRGAEAPVLVAEGFSLWAALFGWVWLLVHRAWIPAALVLAAALFIGSFAALIGSAMPIIGLLLLQGLVGRDLQRWGLARRGYTEGPVVAAADGDAALVRLRDNTPAAAI